MAGKSRPRRAYRTALRHEHAEQTRQRVVAAARRAVVSGIYSRVTIDEIARQAGVASQTVYASFGSKLGLADAVIAADMPHIAAAMAAFDEATKKADVQSWLKALAAMSRRIYEPCADLMRFLRESGDADLLARYREVEHGRYVRLAPLLDLLGKMDRPKSALGAAQAVDVVWSLTGPDHYIELVFERGWQPDAYESWLARTLNHTVRR